MNNNENTTNEEIHIVFWSKYDQLSESLKSN